jgi:hypothetical protein
MNPWQWCVLRQAIDAGHAHHDPADRRDRGSFICEMDAVLPQGIPRLGQPFHERAVCVSVSAQRIPAGSL